MGAYVTTCPACHGRGGSWSGAIGYRDGKPFSETKEDWRCVVCNGQGRVRVNIIGPANDCVIPHETAHAETR